MLALWLFVTTFAFAKTNELYHLEMLRTPKSFPESTSKSVITVAVIDTGIDLKHPKLAKNLWVNEKEIPNNGIDDDGNGYVDDIHGWDFASQDPEPEDRHGHGTHVSHLILTQSPHVRIMVLKYYDLKAPKLNTLVTTVDALRYAVQQNVDIINYSGGGGEASESEKRILEEAQEKGILVVAAAGNEGHNMAHRPFYPASYGLNNIISVTSVDREGRTLSSSNYSENHVQIAAPGKDIFSLLPDFKWGTMTGTSQATALVSGAAAQLLVQRPELKGQIHLMKQTLLSGARVKSGLKGKVKDQLILDSYAPSYMSSSNLSPFNEKIEVPDGISNIELIGDKF